MLRPSAQDAEEIMFPTDPATGIVDFIQLDTPIELVQAILHKCPEGLSVDKLCAVSTYLYTCVCIFMFLSGLFYYYYYYYFIHLGAP